MFLHVLIIEEGLEKREKRCWGKYLERKRRNNLKSGKVSDKRQGEKRGREKNNLTSKGGKHWEGLLG